MESQPTLRHISEATRTPMMVSLLVRRSIRVPPTVSQISMTTPFRDRNSNQIPAITTQERK